MFGQLFDPNNFLWSSLGKLVDFVGLGLFWAALCLPVVTIGPSTAALYYTVVKCFRQKGERAFAMMWRAFVSNLKQGIAATAICLPFAAAFFFGYMVMASNAASGFGTVMYVAYFVILLIPFGLVCWLCAVMARFEMKIKKLFSLSFTLEIRHLPSTVAIVLIDAFLLLWTLNSWWPVFFTPVLAILLTSLFLERIFPKYLTEEETAVLKDEKPEDIYRE